MDGQQHNETGGRWTEEETSNAQVYNKSINNMTDINQVTQVAKGVSDYGMMAVTLQSMLEVSETTLQASVAAGNYGSRQGCSFD